MSPSAVRWAVVGAAALVCTSTAGLSRAQEADAAVAASGEAAPPVEVKPTPSVLAGAANLTAAEHALQLMKAADELRARASKETDLLLESWIPLDGVTPLSILVGAELQIGVGDGPID